MNATSNQNRTIFQLQQSRSLALREESIGNRIRKIRSIERWTLENRDRIRDAVYNDLGKPASPADISEVYTVAAEARVASRNLKRWSRPRKVDTPITQLGTRSTIVFEPMGVCLIISPWNFPFNLSIIPLISCIAAGNTAIVKPSEMSAHTSALIKEMCTELFDESDVAVVEGGKEVATDLLNLPFDHIFFTGSPAIGKIVMRAAAEHLSKVTLELGGKNPVVIAPDANIRDAARKIAWGNFLNCGQSCVASDYLLVPAGLEQQLADELKAQIEKFYVGEMAGSTLGRIINEAHWERLRELIEVSDKEGLEIRQFGTVNKSELRIPPTIIRGVTPDATIMEDEIFGPILPMIRYESIEEALHLIQSRPKPLAIYLFTGNRKLKQRFTKLTSSGALVINDLVIQFGNSNLPFGGVNTSGSGKSHGFAGYREFSNEKPVVRQLRGLTVIQLFYPPYNRLKRLVIKIASKYL